MACLVGRKSFARTAWTYTCCNVNVVDGEGGGETAPAGCAVKQYSWRASQCSEEA